MGFYIRKGFNFGPFRLNLSRSGFGASVGVKGARVGTGPRGAYVHMGREGLYYRHALHGPPSESPSSHPPENVNSSHDAKTIASSAAATMADPSAGQVLTDLNRIQKRIDRFPWAVGFSLIFSLWAGVAAPSWAFFSALVVGTAICIWARHSDVSNGTAVLNYYLDTTESAFAALQSAFEQLSSCDRIWSLDSSAIVANVKYAAGANTHLTRSGAEVGFSAPPRVQSNLRIPWVKAGSSTLYFFPDRLFVYDSSGVGAIRYEMFQIEWLVTKFVEAERVPRDATRVGTTWRYLNKSGGPDRRFRDNPQYPVIGYSLLGFDSDVGLRVALMCSRQDAAGRFCEMFPRGFAKANIAIKPGMSPTPPV